METREPAKILALSLISAAPLFFFGRFLAGLITQPELIITTTTYLTETVGLFLILIFCGATLTLAPSATTKTDQLFLAGVLPTLALFLPQLLLAHGPILIPIFSALIFFLSDLKLNFDIRSSIRNTVKLKGMRLYPTPLKGLVFALALIASLTAGASYQLKIEREGFRIPDPILDSILNRITPTLQNQLENPMKKQPVPTAGNLNWNAKTPHEGREVDPTKAMSELRKNIAERLNAMIAPYEKFVAPTIAVLFFFTVHFLGRLTLLISPLITTLGVKILLAAGFLHKERETVEVERLRL